MDVSSPAKEVVKVVEKVTETPVSATVSPSSAEKKKSAPIKKKKSVSTDSLEDIAKEQPQNKKVKKEATLTVVKDKASPNAKVTKAKKDPNAPKQGKTAYILFGNKLRTKLKESNPDMTFGEVAAALSKGWSEATEEQKAPFIKEAEEDSKRYKTEQAAYLLTNPNPDAGNKKENSSSSSTKTTAKSSKSKASNSDSNSNSNSNGNGNGVLSANNKKKFNDLQNKLDDLQKKMSIETGKIDTINKRINAVKWPIKDELVLSTLITQNALNNKGSVKSNKSSYKDDSSSSKNPSLLQKSLPKATVTLPLDDKDKYLASDLIACWDFINVFSKQLELAQIGLDQFIDLLKYRGQDSIAFVEIFMAPLRVIISDTDLCLKLSLDIPLDTNFARKVTSVELQVGALGTLGKEIQRDVGNDNGNDMNIEDKDDISFSFTGVPSLTQALVNERRTYNKSISLLPRRLRIDLIDSLRWQAVCKAILPSLPPVRAFLKLSLELENLTTDEAALETNRQWTYGSTVDGRELSNTSARQKEKQEKKLKANLLESAQNFKNSPQAISQVSHLLIQSNTFHRNKDIDIDSALCITSDVKENLSKLRDAMQSLHEGDLYKTTLSNKLFILKMLFSACYSTKAFVDKISENCEKIFDAKRERNKEIQAIRAKKAEGSKTERDRAERICRDEMKEAAAEKEKVAKEKEAKAAQKAAAIEDKKAAAAATTSTEGGKPTATSASTKESSKKKGGAGAKRKAEDDVTTTAGDSAPAKKKGPAKNRDPLQPSNNAIQAKVEELLFWDHLGISGVWELNDEVLTDDEEGSDDDDEEVADTVEIDGEVISLGTKPKTSKRRVPLSRAQTAERAEKLLEIKRLNDSRYLAIENLENAIESNREQDLKRAIRIGKKENMQRWTEADGKEYCTPLLYKAEKMMYDIEAKTAADKIEADFDKTMNEYTVRTEPLGSDRYGNTYWAFQGDPDRLYVCMNNNNSKSKNRFSLNSNNNGLEEGSSSSSSTSNNANESSSNSNSVVHTNVPSGSEIALFKKDPTLKVLFNSRPFVSKEEKETWLIYASEPEIYYLWEALDDRGIRERELRQKIRSAFDYTFDPPTVYTTEHRWIGRQIQRVYKKNHEHAHRSVANNLGDIVGYLPKEEDDDDEVWKVVYKDGFWEELEEDEILHFLIGDDVIEEEESKQETTEEASGTAATDISMDTATDTDAVATISPGESTDNLEQLDRRASSRVSLITDQQAVETKTKEENTNNNMQVVNESDTESEDDNEVPEVVYIYDNKDTNRSYMHRPTRAGEVGFTGLKHDINIFLKIIIEGLKNALEGEEKSLTKDTQNILKKMVETSESVTDLRNVILEIENTVYTLASDKKDLIDQVEADLVQQAEHVDLVKQGWCFDRKDSQWIGRCSRRFFLRTGASDGVITAVHNSIDPKTSITTTKYLMEHSDGDTEELDENGVYLATRAFQLNHMSDISAASRLERGDMSDDDDDDDEDAIYDDRESDDMLQELEEQEDKLWKIEADENADEDVIERLWPTVGVRNRWLSAVKESSCVADLAVAMSALHAQAISFGCTGENLFEIQRIRSPHSIFKKTLHIKDKNAKSKKNGNSRGNSKDKHTGFDHGDTYQGRRSSRVNYSGQE